MASINLNKYAGQETKVRSRHGTMDWLKIGKGVHQGCMLSPCLFNLFAEYVMQNPGLDEALSGIKIAWRNINNLRYINVTILVAESKEELKGLLMKVKEESGKTWLKTQLKNQRACSLWLSFKSTKIIATSPITSEQNTIEGAKVATVTDFSFLGLQNHCGR